MRKIKILFIFIIVGFIFITNKSSKTIASDDDYELKGCLPSPAYMTTKGMTDTSVYVDYSLEDTIYKVDYCSDINYDEAYKKNEYDTDKENNYITCLSNDKNCNSKIKEYATYSLCGVEQGQCFFKRGNRSRFKIMCCSNSSVKDKEGEFLTNISQDTLPDNRCINTSNPDIYIDISDDLLAQNNCTEQSYSYDHCKDDIDSINGKDIPDGMKYSCESGENLGSNKGRCCALTKVSLPTASFSGCENVPEDEKTDCESCIWKDKAAGEPTGAVWTEFGCVDPSPAGLITRAFQIGVGIMGGVGVIRIIQIAYILQGNDSQKKQEAPGMIWGLAGGFLFMAVGLLILKYLGINVIGLPEGFLGR